MSPVSYSQINKPCISVSTKIQDKHEIPFLRTFCTILCQCIFKYRDNVEEFEPVNLVQGLTNYIINIWHISINPVVHMYNGRRKTVWQFDNIWMFTASSDDLYSLLKS